MLMTILGLHKSHNTIQIHNTRNNVNGIDYIVLMFFFFYIGVTNYN